MNLQIRDPRVHQLARTLARARKTTMTEVVRQALEAEAARAVPLHRDVARVAAEIRADLDRISQPGGHRMTKEEIDEMWGQ